MQLLRAEIEMNAMKAENKQREILGQSMAYTGDDFMSLIDKYEIYHNDSNTVLLSKRSPEARA